MSTFADSLPKDAPKENIPTPYLKFEPRYSCEADEVLGLSLPYRDHPATPWFHAWALEFVVRRSVPSGPRLIRQTIELPKAIEALAWAVHARNERSYRRPFFQAIEGRVPNPPGPHLTEALLSYATSQKAELRAEATARLVELGPAAIPLLQEAMKKATDKKKPYYQQVIDELSVTTASATGSLSVALRAVRQNDPTTAMLELRAWWEQTRSRAVLPLLEKLQAQLDRPNQAFRTEKEAAAWWEGIARRKNPAELGWILPSLVTPNYREVKMRLELLADFPLDPRIADTVTRFLESDPYAAYTSAEAVYRTGLAVLATMGDTAVLERVYALAPRWNERGPYSKPAMEAFSGRALKASLDALSPRPVTAEELGTLGELERAVVQKKTMTREEFLEQIYADPGSDDPRLVYADWLSERNDPRGEFISLQIARARGEGTEAGLARENELLEKHRVAWETDGASDMMENITYERGFPVTAAVRWGENVVARLAEKVAWSTVQQIRIFWGVPSAQDIDTLLKAPPFRNITSFSGAHTEKMLGVYPQITQVTEHRGQGIDLSAFPNLQEVVLHLRQSGYRNQNNNDQLSLEEHRRLDALDRRHISRIQYRTPLHYVCRIIGYKPVNITEITLSESDNWYGEDDKRGWVLKIEKGNNDTMSVVTATLVSRSPVEQLTSMVNAIPEGLMERLTVVLDGNYRFDTAELTRLKIAVERKPGLVLEVPEKWRKQIAKW